MRFFIITCFLILGSCTRLSDIIAYETSIKRIEIANRTLPQYATFDLRDPAIIDQLDSAGFTSFEWLKPDGTVAIWYKQGKTPTTTFNIKSVSKTLYSALVGQAVSQGKIDIENSIETFSQCRVPAALAPLSHEILLNMTAGFDFTENVSTAVYAAPRWACRAMELPVVVPSGSRFNYNTLQYHLSGIALSETSGQNIATMLQNDLFEPLDIRLDGWVVTPDGDVFVGSEMRLQTRDMLRFGHLYLRNGRWNGQQIIPEHWVKRSRQPTPHSTGRDGISYGLGWWHTRLSGMDAQFAEGYGGQAIIVVPQARQVFAFTAPTGGLVPARQHDTRVAAFQKITAGILARQHHHPSPHP